jgi:tRNA pseudouridine32 synthase/23S rRNA pseudouridine746 synthase
LRPLALAEFWWGAPTRGAYLHASFHVPCADKCVPILGHMLNGL